MTIRIVAVGDQHFKVNNSYETDILHSSLIKELVKIKPDAIVLEGDLLDKFESINVRPFNRALSFISDILQYCDNVFLLIGNHDRPNNNVFLTDEHPFNPLKRWEGITVVDKVIIKRITSSSTDESAEFVFIPYVPVGRLREALNTVELDHPIENPNLNKKQWERLQSLAGAFSHQEFYGAEIGIKKSTEGDLWPPDAPFMASGHIHNEKYLQPNLHYTGTPMQHGFYDLTHKTISIYNYENKNGKWIMSKEEKINLRVPKKIHLKLTKEELLEFELIEDATIIKIDIEIDQIEFLHLMKNKKIKKLINEGVKIKPINTRKQIKKNQLGFVVQIKMSYTKRLTKAINEADLEVKEEFEGLFGTLQIEKSIPKIKITNISKDRSEIIKSSSNNSSSKSYKTLPVKNDHYLKEKSNSEIVAQSPNKRIKINISKSKDK